MATLSGSALAEDTWGTDKPAAKPAAEKTADGVRKDPKGVTGISPFWEALQAGDSAFVARQYTVALQKYQEAIQKAPHKTLAHYRAGEAALAAGDKDAAQSSWEAGLRYASKPVMKAKLLFVLADLEERRGATDKARVGKSIRRSSKPRRRWLLAQASRPSASRDSKRRRSFRSNTRPSKSASPHAPQPPRNSSAYSLSRRQPLGLARDRATDDQDRPPSQPALVSSAASRAPDAEVSVETGAAAWKSSLPSPTVTLIVSPGLNSPARIACASSFSM